MTFWLLVSALVLLAIGFCLPLWRGATGGDVESDAARARSAAARQAYNAALYSDYQQELAEDRTLEEAAKAALLADKARQLRAALVHVAHGVWIKDMQVNASFVLKVHTLPTAPRVQNKTAGIAT